MSLRYHACKPPLVSTRTVNNATNNVRKIPEISKRGVCSLPTRKVVKLSFALGRKIPRRMSTTLSVSPANVFLLVHAATIILYLSLIRHFFYFPWRIRSDALCVTWNEKNVLFENQKGQQTAEKPERINSGGRPIVHENSNRPKSRGERASLTRE